MTIGSVLSYIFFQLLVPLCFTISAVTFLWGACLYIISGSQDEELGEKGKAVMLYGLLALIVTMVGYGILSLIRAQAG